VSEPSHAGSENSASRSSSDRPMTVANNPAAVDGLRRRLRQGAPLAAAVLSLPHPSLAELIGWAGADIVVLDQEHGTFTPDTSLSCVQALASTPAAAVVRVAANEETSIKEALDLGVDVVLVPMVRTAEDVESAVRWSRYPPDGERGAGVTRANHYGLAGAEHSQRANESVAVMGLIETADAVENIDAITDVPGLDAVLLGPADLSASLGVGGDVKHPVVARAISDVLRSAQRASLCSGMPCPPSEAPMFFEQGVRVFMCLHDMFTFSALAQATFADLRRQLSLAPPKAHNQDQ
jgi:2-keto-3-deoxy-L-rhamnonate aldolase RhmA